MMAGPQVHSTDVTPADLLAGLWGQMLQMSTAVLLGDGAGGFGPASPDISVQPLSWGVKLLALSNFSI